MVFHTHTILLVCSHVTILMNCHYDENIQENLFFKEISQNHKDLIDKVIEESWIICVPRSGTFQTTSITNNDILDHILVSDIDAPSQYCCTISKKQVHVQGKQIIPKSEDLHQGKVQVLFEETFYTDNGRKYTVWCIDKPLNRKSISDANSLGSLDNLYDCVDLLWSESFGDNVLDEIHKLCDEFFLHNSNFTTQTLQVQKELIGSLYSRCLQATLKNTYLLEKIKVLHTFLDDIKLAVETCMQSFLGNKLFFSVCTCMWQEDAEFNKYIQNLPTLEFNDFNLPDELQTEICSAKCELSKINKHFTILGKVNCLKNMFRTFSRSSNQRTYVTTDDLLQIFVYLILKLPVNNWFANLTFITEFRFSSEDVSDESSFLIASLEAAIYYIKCGSVVNNTTSAEHTQCDNIRDIKQLLEINNNKSTTQINNRKLCHPLCGCSDCKTIIENGDENISSKSNDRTILHLAAFYGKLNIVECLLEEDCELNAADEHGNTALHLAAQKGHQDVLLYLIQAKAKINVQNNEGNTCLHLATNNGHESCVKAIVYSARNVDLNVPNTWGNTPLHLATKWGYLKIAVILVESGASINVTNKSKQKPIHLAHNYYILEMLEHGAAINEVKSIKKTVKFVDSEEKTSKPCCSYAVEYGVHAKSVEQQKKFDLLLKAIENNDLPLTCYYLGFSNPIVLSSANGSSCHPLCNCDKCSNLSENDLSESLPKSIEHCNVNMCNADGYTALHVAAKHGRVEILRLLLDSGALPNVRTCDTFYTPLHLACMNERLPIVRELLKCGGCSLDVQDVRGNTPLFYACLKNNIKTFELLLTHGADTNVKNNNNVTVWQEAERKMMTSILKLLRDSKKCAVEDSDNEIFS